VDLRPIAEHEGGITEVEEVISDEEGFVDSGGGCNIVIDDFTEVNGTVVEANFTDDKGDVEGDGDVDAI
jgi:hypothetical protein